MRGSDIAWLPTTYVHVIANFLRKRGFATTRAPTAREPNGFPIVCTSKAEHTCPAGLEEILNVYWNDYPDHSCDRLARRLHRRRRRTVLRHRILRRRRPRSCDCYSADPAADGKAVNSN